MKIRLSSLTMSALVVTAVLLTPGRSWGVFFSLGPSNNEWGLKYNLELNAASDDVLNVAFTLADQGRLKPIYSATVVAFSEVRSDGGRSYLVKTPIELKATKEGSLTGQAQIRKEFAGIATIRILTLNFDGRRQKAGAVYYDIPLKKFLAPTPVADSASTSPSSKIVK